MIGVTRHPLDQCCTVSRLDEEGPNLGRYWLKPRRPDIGALLEEFDRRGWTIEDPPTYYMVKCPCGSHFRWIHLTPSGSNYARNALKWLDRQPCSKEGT
jgi:hypothetical protein